MMCIQGGKYDYLHAKYMYNLRNQPANPVKAGALIGKSIHGLIMSESSWMNKNILIV